MGFTSEIMSQHDASSATVCNAQLRGPVFIISNNSLKRVWNKVGKYIRFFLTCLPWPNYLAKHFLGQFRNTINFELTLLDYSNKIDLNTFESFVSTKKEAFQAYLQRKINRNGYQTIEAAEDAIRLIKVAGGSFGEVFSDEEIDDFLAQEGG